MADQVYVTHCLQSDSVMNDAGFSIRASSTRDAELLKFALDFPAYELPLDMWSSDPTPLQAPRRLALIPAPRDKVALIHSAYVEKDTVGRPGSYFSHVIYYPALTAKQALESWGAAGWTTSYAMGQPKTLAALSDEPLRGTWLNPQTLASFLCGRKMGGNDNLATAVFPPRLQNDSRRAQDLLEKTIQGLLHAFHDESGSRNRFYLAAEPGLVALLLYGAVCLLPGDSAAALTFSTFENMHRSLRQFKLAVACGTFTSDAGKGLEPEYFRSRGFGLDTLAPEKSSPELQGEATPAIKALVRLAAEGKWDVIQAIHRCHVSRRVTDESLRAAFRSYETLARAKDNRLTLDELLELAQTPHGMAFIDKNEDVFWPHIYRHSFKHEPVRQQFGPLLQEHLPELVGQAGQLLAGSSTQWKSVWSLVKAVEKSRDQLAAYCLAILQMANKADPRKAYVAAMRSSFLQEWNEVHPRNNGLPAPVQELLNLASAREFEQLKELSLPDDWLAFALQAGLQGAKSKPWVREAFIAAPDNLVKKVVAGINAKKSGTEAQAVLQKLIPDSEGFPLFFRLLKNGLSMPPETACQFLDALNETNAHLSRSWFQEDHLELFLCSLAPFKERAAPLWQRFCRFLSKDLLLGDSKQRALFDNLKSARTKCPNGLPAETEQVLDDWSFLVQVVDDPEQKTSSKEIEGALQRCRLPNASDFLKEYFARAVLDKGSLDDKIEAFIAVFHKLYPLGAFYQNHLSRFDRWVQIMKACGDPRQAAALQLFFLDRHIPRDVRLQVAKDRKSVIGDAALRSLARSLAEQKTTQLAAATDEPDAMPLREAYSRLSLRTQLVIVGVLVGSHLLLLLLALWMGRGQGSTPPPAADENAITLDRKALASLHEGLEAHKKALEGAPLLASAGVKPSDLGTRLSELNKAIASGDQAAVEKALAAVAEGLKAEPGVLEKRFSQAKEQLEDQTLVALVEKEMQRSLLAKQDIDEFGKQLRKSLATAKNKQGARRKVIAFLIGVKDRSEFHASSLILSGTRVNALYVAANVGYWLDRSLADTHRVRELIESIARPGP